MRYATYPRMDHPKAIGDRSQLVAMLALRRAGFDLSVPFGENTRYDLVIDDGKSLARVQCKTGRFRKGAVVWNVCSSNAHHPNPRPKRHTTTKTTWSSSVSTVPTLSRCI